MYSKIYTPQMKREIDALKVPHDFMVDIVEYDGYPPFLGLRFYESHWRYLSEIERLRCIEYLSKMKNIIQSHGVGATIDPVYDVPGGQKLG